MTSCTKGWHPDEACSHRPQRTEVTGVTGAPAAFQAVAKLRPLLLAVVVSHACVVVWHLIVVANINPAVVTPGFLVFLGTINLFPFVAVALSNTRVRLLAG